MQEWCAIDSGFRPHLEPDVRRLEAAGIPARLVDVADPEAGDTNPFLATVLQVPAEQQDVARKLLGIPRETAVPVGWLVRAGTLFILILWLGLFVYFVIAALYFSYGGARFALLILAAGVGWVGWYFVRAQWRNDQLSDGTHP